MQARFDHNNEMPLGRESHLFSLGMMVVLILWQIASVNPACQKNYFYDHGTDKCEPCSDICHMANYQKTEDQCARLCPDYNVPGTSVAATDTPRSSPAIAVIASFAVLAGLCLIVFVVVSNRQTFARLWRRARSSPAGTSPEDCEASQSLSVGVQEVGDGGAGSLHIDDNPNHRVQEESENGRFGAHELALVGSSAESGLSDENVEPKTLHI